MRTPTYAQCIRSAAMVAALSALSACGTLRATIGAYETGPMGIARPQQRLRDALARADFREALAWKEDDALLGALTTGVSSYYALQFARSAAVLDSAALMADDRITTSVSKNALSLVTNDLALPYQPRRTERLFIPYYGMLAYARLGQWEDAAVEARRISALLAQYAADRTDAERATHATMHYLAGVVFERAGEKAEAQVAYRLASSLAGVTGDTSPRAKGSQEGEVLVVVERGFVAHRATESINLFFDNDDDSSRTHHGEHLPRIRERGHRGDDDEDGYWLAVAFPSLRRSPRVFGDAQAYVDGASADGARMTSVLDDASGADEARERTGLLVRAAARATAKYAVTKAVKDKKGEVAGTIANIGASLLERADIRSWHLLPQEITVMRVRVPAGQHQLSVGVADCDEGSRVDVGPVTVHPGEVTIAAVRLWGEPPRRTMASR
ncbi:MAG: hypothetical protein ABIY52_09890 [Gemmatimonadaceae bacterium]